MVDARGRKEHHWTDATVNKGMAESAARWLDQENPKGAPHAVLEFIQLVHLPYKEDRSIAEICKAKYEECSGVQEHFEKEIKELKELLDEGCDNLIARQFIGPHKDDKVWVEDWYRRVLKHTGTKDAEEA
jgi:hypothetical protein